MPRNAPKQRSVMKHSFSQVARADINRSTFNRSHAYKTTFDAGYLIPFLLDEVYPGDTFNVRATILARLATPLKPVMDNMFLDTFFFFVPNRLVWDSWARFMGEQENPGDSTDFTIPVVSAHSITENSIYDYLGLPANKTLSNASALPLRGCNLIWNEWFRDQNLQNSLTVEKGPGPDPSTNYTLQRRGKRHDYFTSCLPWPQKGPGVNLPLGISAPINAPTTSGTDTIGIIADDLSADRILLPVTDTAIIRGATVSDAALYADLTQATAATINDLRQAFQIQRLQERDARGGTRLQELVLAHFGVRGSDARLQRPEYLGGGSTPLIITQVPQTSDQISGGPGAETPQGNLAAYGTAVGAKHGFTKSFEEHGFIFGFVSARADLTYQQGLQRFWSRQTKYDFYFPALAHLGEQAVLNKEIFYNNNAADNDVFGYQEPWSELRYKPSQITGLFRSTATESLDVWHLSQEFANLPVLNSEFIEDDPPVDRVIAVQDEPHFLMDAYINMKCARPMPVFGVPGYIDHF